MSSKYCVNACRKFNVAMDFQKLGDGELDKMDAHVATLVIRFMSIRRAQTFAQEVRVDRNKFRSWVSQSESMLLCNNCMRLFDHLFLYR